MKVEILNVCGMCLDASVCHTHMRKKEREWAGGTEKREGERDGQTEIWRLEDGRRSQCSTFSTLHSTSQTPD